MLSGFKHHFCASHYCLSREPVCLSPWHSVSYSRVCHCFDEHKDVCRRAAAYRYYRVHKVFAYNFRYSEPTEYFADVFKLFDGDVFVWRYSRYACADHSGSIRHCADNFQLTAAESLGERSESLSGRNGNNDLFVCNEWSDFGYYLSIVLRLYGKYKRAAFLCYCLVVRSCPDAVPFADKGKAFLADIRHHYIICIYNSAGYNSAHHCGRHIAGSNKAELSACIVCVVHKSVPPLKKFMPARA